MLRKSKPGANVAGLSGNATYRFTFKRHVDLDDIADSLTLAICAAEGLHGRAKVRLDGSWRLDRQRRCCLIDASTPLGADLAKLFTGYLAKEFGESAFRVTPVKSGLGANTR